MLLGPVQAASQTSFVRRNMIGFYRVSMMRQALLMRRTREFASLV
jgi:hypothetical protein